MSDYQDGRDIGRKEGIDCVLRALEEEAPDIAFMAALEKRLAPEAQRKERDRD